MSRETMAILIALTRGNNGEVDLVSSHSAYDELGLRGKIPRLEQHEAWLLALQDDQMWTPPNLPMHFIPDLTYSQVLGITKFLEDFSPFFAAADAYSTTDPKLALEYMEAPEEWVTETPLYGALLEQLQRIITSK